jgi:hypothetical protein
MDDIPGLQRDSSVVTNGCAQKIYLSELVGIDGLVCNRPSKIPLLSMRKGTIIIYKIAHVFRVCDKSFHESSLGPVYLITRIPTLVRRVCTSELPNCRKIQ